MTNGPYYTFEDNANMHPVVETIGNIRAHLNNHIIKPIEFGDGLEYEDSGYTAFSVFVRCPCGGKWEIPRVLLRSFMSLEGYSLVDVVRSLNDFYAKDISDALKEDREMARTNKANVQQIEKQESAVKIIKDIGPPKQSSISYMEIDDEDDEDD